MNIKQLKTTQCELNRAWTRCYRHKAGNNILVAIEAAMSATQAEIDEIKMVIRTSIEESCK